MSTAYRNFKTSLIQLLLLGVLSLCRPAGAATTYNYLLLPPCTATTQIIFMASTTTPTFGCASSYTFNSATNTMTLGAAATPGTITAPTPSAAAGTGLTFTATAGNGTNSAGGPLTFNSGNATGSGAAGNITYNIGKGTPTAGSTDGQLLYNLGGAGSLKWTLTGGTLSSTNHVLTFSAGDFDQACTFQAGAGGADCLIQVANLGTQAGDYAHFQEVDGGGDVIDMSVAPATATNFVSQCSNTTVPVTCWSATPGANAMTWGIQMNGGEMILSNVQAQLLLNFGTPAFSATTAGTSIATTAGDSSNAASVTNVVGGSATNTRANGVPIVTQALTAPTISSGFGSTPSVTQNAGPKSFSINVGTGGSASSGVVGLPAAAHAWACSSSDTGATPTGSTQVTGPSSTTTVTVTNFSRTTGSPVAWTASEIIQLSCWAN